MVNERAHKSGEVITESMLQDTVVSTSRCRMCANGELQTYSYEDEKGEVTVKVGVKTDRRIDSKLVVNIMESYSLSVRCFEVRVYCCPRCGKRISHYEYPDGSKEEVEHEVSGHAQERK